jgi:hypothetical protein
MSHEYTLYGAPMSLYTGKARAYLIFKNLPYKEVFSSLKVYKSIIAPNMPGFIRALLGKKVGAKFKGFVHIALQ